MTMESWISDPETRVLEAFEFLSQANHGGLPSYKQIAIRSGVSERMVPDYLRRLQDNGLLRMTQHSRYVVETDLLEY
jgi:DNA-binding IclR family transcriptional regulator